MGIEEGLEDKLEQKSYKNIIKNMATALCLVGTFSAAGSHLLVKSGVLDVLDYTLKDEFWAQLNPYASSEISDNTLLEKTHIGVRDYFSQIQFPQGQAPFYSIPPRDVIKKQASQFPQKQVSLGDNSLDEIIEQMRMSSYNLQERVERVVDYFKHHGTITPDERVAWCVYDIRASQKLVDINCDVPMQMASLVKPLVALAFFHRVAKGELDYGDKSEQNMRNMLQRSSNYATNELLDDIGGPRKMQEILDENYGYIFKDTKIVEKIPRYGRTYKNMASASDYVRFLLSLLQRTLPYSEEILSFMEMSAKGRMYSAEEIPKDTMFYNKTGTTALGFGEMMILFLENGEPYIVIGLNDRENRFSSQWKWWDLNRESMRKIAGVIYNGMQERVGIQERNYSYNYLSLP